MKNESGERSTANRIAKDMILAALNGRMYELCEEIRDRLPDATDRQTDEVERCIIKHLRRLKRAL